MKNFCFAYCIVYLLNVNFAFASEKGGMPQLDPEYWTAQIFWLILTFSILYVIILKIFLPRITLSIENRKSKIINDLQEAQKLKENAENKLIEYNNILENSKKEAKKIIEDCKKKINNDIENKKKKFADEIEKELISVEKEIKDLKKSSIPSINKIAIETSTEIIKQIINTEINKSSVAAIVNEAVKKKIEKQNI